MLNSDWLKRFDVTEIVLPVGLADAIFGGREATTGNASAVRRLGPNLCFWVGYGFESGFLAGIF